MSINRIFSGRARIPGGFGGVTQDIRAIVRLKSLLVKLGIKSVRHNQFLRLYGFR